MNLEKWVRQMLLLVDDHSSGVVIYNAGGTFRKMLVCLEKGQVNLLARVEPDEPSDDWEKG